MPELRRLLTDMLPGRKSVNDFQVVHDFPGLGRRVMTLNARRIEGAGEPAALILLSIEDITESREELLRLNGELTHIAYATSNDLPERQMREAHDELAAKAKELARSNEELQQFAYVASHDLQEPLRMVVSYTQLLAREYQGKLDGQADQFIAHAVEGCQRMETLLKNLREYWSVNEHWDDTSARTDCNAALEQATRNLGGTIEGAHYHARSAAKLRRRRSSAGAALPKPYQQRRQIRRKGENPDSDRREPGRHVAYFGADMESALRRN
jgi:signal transduction histidine kinase